MDSIFQESLNTFDSHKSLFWMWILGLIFTKLLAEVINFVVHGDSNNNGEAVNLMISSKVWKTYVILVCGEAGAYWLVLTGCLFQ